MAGALIGAATIGAVGSMGAAGMGMASSSAANKANQKMMDRQMTVAEVRIPPFVQASQGIPPGYVFNRKKVFNIIILKQIKKINCLVIN